MIWGGGCQGLGGRTAGAVTAGLAGVAAAAELGLEPSNECICVPGQPP